ncbi:hypothetical protein XELAEV_18009363mg [Xenopus laevis]|uniref:Helix-turn-helix domain-containing protein n=1 Tax=Xenopus laevis TaxID=8355 RepID=A0A974DTH1_XENLA|nr:hypothetical protein XELAEV_18009363mg [Xenopus laevis]
MLDDFKSEILKGMSYFYTVTRYWQRFISCIDGRSILGKPISHYLSGFHNIRETFTKGRCVAWWKYINDVFLLWRDDLESLSVFHDVINTAHQSIKLTMTASLQEISFLDVLISRSGHGFQTHIFTKPTDSNQLLSYDSCHPPGVKRSIPISQFSKVCRITIDPCVWDEDLKIMSSKLLDRGYINHMIQKNKEMVQKKERERQKYKHRSQNQRVTFISQYNAFCNNCKSILYKHWHLLRDAYPFILDF